MSEEQKDWWVYGDNSDRTYCTNLDVTEGVGNTIRLEYIKDGVRVIRLLPATKPLAFHRTGYE